MDLLKFLEEIRAGQEKILEMIEGMQKNASKTKQVYTFGDLAEIFQVSTRTIYNWKDQGLLSFVQVGSKTYFTSNHLEDFLKKNEVKSKFCKL